MKLNGAKNVEACRKPVSFMYYSCRDSKSFGSCHNYLGIVWYSKFLFLSSHGGLLPLINGHRGAVSKCRERAKLRYKLLHICHGPIHTYHILCLVIILSRQCERVSVGIDSSCSTTMSRVKYSE